MFKATKPFNDKVTAYPEEPSLRIGRTVPKNAVNLAYYYNPTATDTEKVLTAEAPRQTIDHRVEEAYRYLFNQASDDDDLFPGYVWYDDEEGYQGRLGRMYVAWYPEAHIETKNHQVSMDHIVSRREDVLKMIEYPEDAYGYSGNLYLDTCEYEVYSTRDETTVQHLKRDVYNHELNYSEIFGAYVSPFDLDSWIDAPTSSSSTKWPNRISVYSDKLQCTSGNAKIQNFVNGMSNPYDEATGVLVFDRFEYEPVFNTSSVSGTPSIAQKQSLGAACRSGNYAYPGHITTFYDKDGNPTGDDSAAIMAEAKQFVIDKEAETRNNLFNHAYLAQYNSKTDLYDYSQINNFLTMASSRCVNTGASGFSILRQAMADNKDIAIFLDEMHSVFDNVMDLNSNFHFEASYSFKIADRGEIGLCYYNVIAIYTAIGEHALDKQVTKIKEVPEKYIAHANYTGILRKVWYDYDGVAYYRGAVTKGNSVGNVNPEDDNEFLMFSDANGYLRRPVYHTTEDGATVLTNYYRVEADSIYLTDVFKNDKACFYKYPLKQCIYDYRGPDQNGFYEGDAVKMYTSNLKELPEGYEYSVKLRTAKVTEEEFLRSDGFVAYKEVPVQYYADIYTSFISCSTDTFNITYNAFNDDEDDNVALDSGVTEEVYNYPFMIEGIDYTLEEVDRRQRVNKIKLPKPYRLRDSRYYLTFTFTVNAARKGTCYIAQDGTVKLSKAANIIKSDPITVSILNKDYALPCEYDKFEGRGYIISPMSDGVYYSPMDIILKDQAARRVPTTIKNSDTDYVFYCEISDILHEIRGAVNIKCNPDGSGIITAETTIDTGFIKDVDLWEIDDDFMNNVGNQYANYDNTAKLVLDSPYWIEDGWIYPAMKVKCIDSRYIKVLPPRDDGLLDSWYPRIQFGHYSQVMDQYGAHTKVCYSMPEYDNQHFSTKFGKPYVDVKAEQVTILNSHMIKTKCYPLYIREINKDADTYQFKDKTYKVFKTPMTWKAAQAYCESIGGNLAMPKTKEISDFILSIALKYNFNGLWLGATDEVQEGVWKWVDGTSMTYNNWNTGEPNDSQVTDATQPRKGEHYLETYTSTNAGKWNDLPNGATSQISGFICEFKSNPTVTVYKRVNNELYIINTKDISFSDGIIILDDSISENDDIICDYTYLEESNTYRGYWRNLSDFARIDLNPNIYHTYNDLNYTPSEVKPTKNLFNKVIYFFMRPTLIYEVQESDDDLVYDTDTINIVDDLGDNDLGTIIQQEENTLYHQIDNPVPENNQDIYIGSVFIRQNSSLHSTIVVDSRTRGGGLLSSMSDSLRKELEPESDFYLDIGYYDGEPYQENGVIIVRLDNSILKEFGGRFTPAEVEQKVKRWLGHGIYPIIEYVDSYSKKDMPQYNLTVEDSYTNVMDETPVIHLECIG